MTVMKWKWHLDAAVTAVTDATNVSSFKIRQIVWKYKNVYSKTLFWKVFASHAFFSSATNFMHTWQCVVVVVFFLVFGAGIKLTTTAAAIPSHKYQKYSPCSMFMLLIHISLLRGTIRNSMLDIWKQKNNNNNSIEIKIKTAAGIYFINNCLWIVRVFIFFSLLLFPFFSIMKHIFVRRCMVLKVMNRCGCAHWTWWLNVQDRSNILRELLLDTITWLTSVGNIRHINRNTLSEHSTEQVFFSSSLQPMSNVYIFHKKQFML